VKRSTGCNDSLRQTQGMPSAREDKSKGRRREKGALMTEEKRGKKSKMKRREEAFR